MSDDLREEIARALLASLASSGFQDAEWSGSLPECLKHADTILPIIARALAARAEAGYYQGVDEGYKRACLNRQSPF